MADMIIVYRVMPEDGEVEYEHLESVTKDLVANFDNSVQVKEVGPQEVGFGLKAVKIRFQIDENCGSEALEEKLKKKEEIGDVVLELMDRL